MRVQWRWQGWAAIGVGRESPLTFRSAPVHDPRLPPQSFLFFLRLTIKIVDKLIGIISGKGWGKFNLSHGRFGPPSGDQTISIRNKFSIFRGSIRCNYEILVTSTSKLFDFGSYNTRTIPRRKGVVESGFCFGVSVVIKNMKTYNGIAIDCACRVSDGTRGKRYSNYYYCIFLIINNERVLNVIINKTLLSIKH